MLQNIFGSTKFKDEDIDMLAGLGFSKEKAKDALKEFKGNLEFAANFLLSKQA